MPSGLRTGTAADLELLTEVLFEAFQNDPLIHYMFDGLPDPDAAHRTLAVANTRDVWLPHGEVVIREDEQGVMVWSRPHASAGPSRWDQLRARKTFFQAVGLRRGLQLRQDAKRIGPRHPPWPHTEVAFIGVRPASQGRGTGTALLQHAVDVCDAQQAGMFLETGNPRNLPLYQRSDFVVVDNVRMTRDGPDKWFLWRQPQRSDS